MALVDLVLLAVLLIVAAAVGFVVADLRRGRLTSAPTLAARAGGRARWRAGHRTDGEYTVVHVELSEPDDGAPVLERREVGRIVNTDPDYDRRLDELMDTARQRAVLLDLNRE